MYNHLPVVVCSFVGSVDFFASVIFFLESSLDSQQLEWYMSKMCSFFYV